jgi:Anti-sigma-K factor rskA
VSDQLEPELERVARMLAEAGPLPDAPETLRERALAVPDGGPVAAADIAVAARRPRLRLRLQPVLGIAAVVAAIAVVPTALALRDDAKGQSIELAGRDFAPKSGGTAHVIARGDGSATISLRVWKMPKPGAGTTYEAWLGRTGDRMALGTFKTDATGKATISFKVRPGEMGGYRWIWVTNEPVGGSETPSERTALWGPLT